MGRIIIPDDYQRRMMALRELADAIGDISEALDALANEDDDGAPIKIDWAISALQRARDLMQQED